MCLWFTCHKIHTTSLVIDMNAFLTIACILPHISFIHSKRHILNGTLLTISTVICPSGVYKHRYAEKHERCIVQKWNNALYFRLYSPDCIAYYATRTYSCVHAPLSHSNTWPWWPGTVFALNSNSMQIILVVIQVQIFDRYDIYTSQNITEHHRCRDMSKNWWQQFSYNFNERKTKFPQKFSKMGRSTV